MKKLIGLLMVGLLLVTAGCAGARGETAAFHSENRLLTPAELKVAREEAVQQLMAEGWMIVERHGCTNYPDYNDIKIQRTTAGTTETRDYCYYQMCDH